MILNEKKIKNYKILDLANRYNLDIKFEFIWDHMKKLWIYLSKIICRYTTTEDGKRIKVWRNRQQNRNVAKSIAIAKLREYMFERIEQKKNANCIV